jgi:hypothetical protein
MRSKLRNPNDKAEMSNKVQIPKPKFQMFDIWILTFDILLDPLTPPRRRRIDPFKRNLP